MPDSPVIAVRILRGLRLAEQIVCTMAFALLVGIIFADVVSRELTHAGFYWASQSGVWANVAVVMAGFGLASADGAHLRPRFADHWLPTRWEPVLQTLQHAGMSVFCAAATVLSALVVTDTWRLGVISIDLFLPVWPVQALLPLAFAAATIRHALYAAWAGLRPVESGTVEITVGRR